MRFARLAVALAACFAVGALVASVDDGYSADTDTRIVTSVAADDIQGHDIASDAQENLVEPYAERSGVAAEATHPLEVIAVNDTMTRDTIHCDLQGLEHRTGHRLLQSMLAPYFIVRVGKVAAHEGPDYAHPPSGVQSSAGDGLDLHAFNGA